MAHLEEPIDAERAAPQEEGSLPLPLQRISVTAEVCSACHSTNVQTLALKF